MWPVLFHIGDSPVYSYPLLMGVGWGMAYNLCVTWWLNYHHELKSLKIFTLLSFIVGWIGAKVFFLIFSTPDQVFYYAKEVNFWLGGGFVFYGGFVFVLAFALLYFRFNKKLSYSDLGLLVPGVTMGHGIGRIGCFLAGCCYGSETDSLIAVSFHGHERYPVQLIEASGLFILYFFSRNLLKRKMKVKAIYLYLIGYSFLRFGNEFLRGDEIRGLYSGLATSQWISLAIILITTSVFIMKRKRV